MLGAAIFALFAWFLFWEWPQFIRGLEAAPDNNPDPLVAEIRMARLEAGLPPEPD